MCERISGLIRISVGAMEKVGEVTRWRTSRRRGGGDGGGGGVVLYFLCRSLLFFRARKMGLCNESRDRARNSGGATAAFALPSRSRAFLAASTRTRSSSPKKPKRHSETRAERRFLGS